MIPGRIFTSFAKFQGIVSVNDLKIPIRLQELLQAPLCFLRSFCFARIRLDPLGGQVLHHGCMSMIVSRFTTFTEDEKDGEKCKVEKRSEQMLRTKRG